MQIQVVTPKFSVSPQIQKSNVPAIVDAGFSKIVNNRPDGEAPDQPPSLHLMTAVSNTGMGYLHVPVSGSNISAQDIAVFRQALQSANGPVLAFCRTGTRSIKLWALCEVDNQSVYDVIRIAARAGYDLSDFSDRLVQHAARIKGETHENA